jgi:toxin ParE1/3/4
MSRKFEVLWSAVAERDLNTIFDYIADESPAAALEIFDKLRQKAASLSRFPGRGRMVPEVREQGDILYRELVIPPWRIMYRIEGETVIIFSVLDSRQDVEELLLRRLGDSKP